MSDYISREAAIADFEQYNRENPVWAPQRVKTLLMRIKTADVEPVRHWRWVKDGDFLICPACENEMNIKNSLGADNHKNYCPNCGAKMDLEGDNNEN